MEASGNVRCKREDSGGGHNLEPGGCVQVDITARRQCPGVKRIITTLPEQHHSCETGYASWDTLIDLSYSRGEERSQIVLMNLVLTASLIISFKNQ